MELNSLRDRLNLFIRIFFRRWVERFVAKQFDYVESTRKLKGTRYHVFRIQRKCNNNSKESLRHFSLEILYLGRGYEREKQEVVGSRGEKARETYCSVSLLSRGAATNDLIAHCHATRDFYFLSEAIFPRGFGFCTVPRHRGWFINKLSRFISYSFFSHLRSLYLPLYSLNIISISGIRLRPPWTRYACSSLLNANSPACHAGIVLDKNNDNENNNDDNRKIVVVMRAATGISPFESMMDCVCIYIYIYETRFKRTFEMIFF